MQNKPYNKTILESVSNGGSRTAPKGALWAFVFLILSAVVLGGCGVTVGGKQRPLVGHERIQGELEFVAEKRTDEQGISENKRKSKITVFEERVRLKTKGDVYHPDLLG